MSSATTELRACERYPLQFDVKYRVFGKGHTIFAGTARTINISSHGVLLTPTEATTKGELIELSIDWNSGASGAAKMNLEVLGRVVRIDTRGTAVQILRYGFTSREYSPPMTAN